MELISIVLARFVAVLEVQALDPRGKTTTIEALSQLGARYSFAKTPQTLSEMDFTKGVELLEGRLGDIVVDRLTIFANGFAVDTRSSTDDCEKIARDLLDLMHEAFGATITPNREYCLSQILFRSNLRLAKLNPILQPIADAVRTSVSRDMKHPFTCEPTAIIIGFDLSQIKLAPGPFTIERRQETPFSENLYFSAAPLRTGEHLKAIEEIEVSLI